MAPEAPKKRFAPVPVETSSKSSRSSRGSDESSGKPVVTRKFAVEPTETSVRHSAYKNDSPVEDVTTASKPPRRFAPQPVETSVKKSGQKAMEGDDEPKKPRKFGVQPVETSLKSSRDQSVEDQKRKAPRKFAVQPVEESTKSSHKSVDGQEKKSRFAPQPVESTERRRVSSNTPRRRDSELDETPADIPRGVTINRPTRKFCPQLIDVTTRSRRASDEASPMADSFRTDVIPGHMVNAKGEALFPSVSQKLLLPHERRKERTSSHGNVRSHSFLCPDLETIESSESEASEHGSPDRSMSPSTNDSPLTTSDGLPESYKNNSNRRESVDEGYKYLLDLEAKRAEERLREQALAAFPNSDFHEPVEHYVDDQDDDLADIDDRPATWEGHEDDDGELPPTTWRQNTVKVDWELLDARKHHEDLEKARAAAILAKSHEPPASPWWNAAAARDFASAATLDTEMSTIRKGARPPMLGDELTFPRSQSPEPARFDITQGSHALKSQMCYLTEQADARSRQPSTANGLWGGAASPARSDAGKGLWGGFCSASQSENNGTISPGMPTGLMTPAILEPANPFDETLSHSTKRDTLRPPTPPHTRSKMLKSGIETPKIDKVLNTDGELDSLMNNEYPDSFITQVFNYLSLGYPTLARPFDQELAKISGIPVKVLREDDNVAKSMPKGYIRIGEDFEGRGDGVSQELQLNKCARWRALKQYIREWARQEKGMIRVQAIPIGTAPRKGSWAW